MGWLLTSENETGVRYRRILSLSERVISIRLSCVVGLIIKSIWILRVVICAALDSSMNASDKVEHKRSRSPLFLNTCHHFYPS